MSPAIEPICPSLEDDQCVLNSSATHLCRSRLSQHLLHGTFKKILVNDIEVENCSGHAGTRGNGQRINRPASSVDITTGPHLGRDEMLEA